MKTLILTFLIGASLTALEVQASHRDKLEFFEKRIRPVLVERCYRCHNSARTHRNGLAVDHREAIRAGGDSGPAMVARATHGFRTPGGIATI